MDINATKIMTTFVRLGRRVPGVLYESAAGDGTTAKRTAVLVMHSDEDYLTCPTGPELASRGFTVLCANVMVKEGLFFSQIEKMSCVCAAMDYLKNTLKMDRVYLMGHSGGATLMTCYQAIAENGADIFRGEEMIYPWPEDGRCYIPADGVLLLDANWGNSVMQLLSLDPAVTDEKSGKKINEELNLFNPDNGFRPEGSTYTEAFRRKFMAAQSARNMRILRQAQERLVCIDRGEGNYADDEPLIIPGANQAFFNNKLYPQDISLMAHTREAYDLIHADGSITHEQIRSARKPENPVSMTDNLAEGGRMMTVRNYLSSYAVKTAENYGYDAEHVWGIDWNSTYTSPVSNAAYIHAPMLIMGMTGGGEFLAAEEIYHRAAAEDKSICFVEGASHKFTPATAYEAYPGQFGDTMKLLHDYVAGWLEERQ